MHPSSDVAGLPQRLGDGDAVAFDAILPVVHDQLLMGDELYSCMVS